MTVSNKSSGKGAKKVELTSQELGLMEQAFQALCEQQEQEIEEIKSLDESYYKRHQILNKYREKPLTVQEFKQRDIEKVRVQMKEAQALREKLLLSNNYLLVVSNRITLNLSAK